MMQNANASGVRSLYKYILAWSREPGLIGHNNDTISSSYIELHDYEHKKAACNLKKFTSFTRIVKLWSSENNDSYDKYIF